VRGKERWRKIQGKREGKRGKRERCEDVMKERGKDSLKKMKCWQT
jgi:hypothetical protein